MLIKSFILWLVIQGGGLHSVLAMEEQKSSMPLQGITKNYVLEPRNIAPLKYPQFKAFQEWFLPTVVQSQMASRAFRDHIPSEAELQFIKERQGYIHEFFNFFDLKLKLRNSQLLFDKQQFGKPEEAYVAFVCGFYTIYYHSLEDFLWKFNCYKGIDTGVVKFFKDGAPPELKKHLPTFQRLSNQFLHAYQHHFKKTWPSIGNIPELNHEITHIGYFTDENGYLPIPLSKDTMGLSLQRLPFGEGIFQEELGFRGFLRNSDAQIIRTSGLYIYKTKENAALNLSYYRGEDDPYPFYCLSKEIVDEPVTIVRSLGKAEVIPRRNYEKLSNLIDTLVTTVNDRTEEFFLPIPQAHTSEVGLCNYLILDYLQQELLRDTAKPAMIAAANWILAQEGIEPKETREEVRAGILQLQQQLEEEVCQNYAEEIRAEQEKVMKGHTYQVLSQSTQKGKKQGRNKSRGHRPQQRTTVKESSQEKVTAIDPIIEAKARAYFKENLQKSRVTYQQMCKLIHKMVKNVFAEQQDLFTTNVSGSHNTIHIDSGESLTLVKKHGGRRRDLTYSPKFANNYMSKLLNMGLGALDKSITKKE